MASKKQQTQWPRIQRNPPLSGQEFNEISGHEIKWLIASALFIFYVDQPVG